jgi:hypothetical protein
MFIITYSSSSWKLNELIPSKRPIVSNGSTVDSVVEPCFAEPTSQALWPLYDCLLSVDFLRTYQSYSFTLLFTSSCPLSWSMDHTPFLPPSFRTGTD